MNTRNRRETINTRSELLIDNMLDGNKCERRETKILQVGVGGRVQILGREGPSGS